MLDSTTPKQKNNQQEATKKEIMLSLVEVLYNSSTINDETYKEVKKAIKRGEQL